MNLYIGTSGYGYKEWKGKFYPAKIRPGEMLRFYSERLGTVEINNTFYHMPTESVLISWMEQVPGNFVFAFKAPQLITHFKRLRHAESEVEHLFRTLAVLGGKLGPVLFQFPASFRTDLPLLKDFLALIPAGLCAFEFRSASWSSSPGIADLIQEKGCCLCTVDTDEKPAEEITGTASWGYIRLRRSEYGDSDLPHWLEKILTQKWEKAFIFFKHEETAKSPELAVRFRSLADFRVG